MTDQAINLSGDKRIIETVVDSTYKTKSGALNKVGHLFLLIFVMLTVDCPGTGFAVLPGGGQQHPGGRRLDRPPR